MLLARGVARGADKQWLRDLFSFAVTPDLIFYLQLGVENLVPRVLEAGKMNYWESGLDMNYGDDLYDSFVAYQTALIEQFSALSEEYNFNCVDAQQDSRSIQRQLRREVTVYLQSSNYPNPGAVSQQKNF
jgi:dTMP kinase